MKGQSLLIRADANTQMGTGHVMRCLALARAWQTGGKKATFLSCCESEYLRQRISSSGISLIALEEAHPHPADLPATLSLLERLDDPWLVIDGYHFDSAYQQTVRKAGHRLLVIDDNAHLPEYHANVLLNQNIDAERLPYRYDPDTSLLLGARYALLRPEFLAWRGWRRTIPDRARKVLVTMGGGDPDNITLKVVQAFSQVDIPDLKAKIVVGPTNPHLETLRLAVQSSTLNLRLLTDVADMAELMAWADVAISAGGSTCWELAFMGLPTLVLITASNQRYVAAGLDEAGVALNLGWFTGVDQLSVAAALYDLMNDCSSRTAISFRGSQLVDGRGSGYVVSVLTGNITEERAL